MKHINDNFWANKIFPNIVNQYLEKWRDRFYLFDEKYPFFQVTKEEIAGDKISKAKASSILGKNINRIISESGNKIALFSPKDGENKNTLTAAELARWLITFQGYSGLSDKVIFGNEKYKSSKGWLFDIGAIYIKGNTLFETLLLNYISPYNERGNVENIQRPCWELESSDIIKSYLDEKDITNIASLYTVWSRGIYIDPDFNLNKPFSFEIVKLPDINHRDNFLEPMTIWKYNVSGENRDSYTPKKHFLNQSLWRSFGLLSIKDTNLQYRKPGVIDWLTYIDDIIGNRLSTIVAISMQDDGNATSWLPTDEVIDSIFINDLVLTDLDEGGWVPRINEVVEETKKIISRTYKTYINDIKEIRNISNGSYTQQMVESLYFKIDQPFRQWLASIQPEDNKDSKIQEWRVLLKKIVKAEAEVILHQGGTRDYLGIQKDGRIKNIATAYNSFDFWLRQQLK
jgi:cse1 family CRISPR-associated protein